MAEQPNERITVALKLVDEWGNTYEVNSTFKPLYELGLDIPRSVGVQVNLLLKAAGYRRSKDELFMEDINEDEYEVLLDALHAYRYKVAEGE